MRRAVCALAFACVACAPIAGSPQPDPAAEVLVSIDDLPAGFDAIPADETDPLRFNPIECKDFMGLPKAVETRMSKLVAVNDSTRITIKIGEAAPDEFDVSDFEDFFARCPVVVVGDFRSGAALTAQLYDVPIDAPSYRSRGDVIIEAPADQAYSYGLVLVARVDSMIFTAQLLQSGPSNLPDPPPDLDHMPYRQEFIDVVNLQVDRIQEAR